MEDVTACSHSRGNEVYDFPKAEDWRYSISEDLIIKSLIHFAVILSAYVVHTYDCEMRVFWGL